MENETKWSELLKLALTEPGSVSKAFHAFHGYSLGNQMLALLQCSTRHIQPGPIATYPGWQTKGRQVRKGEKAISLWMPINSKKRVTERDENGDEVESEVPFARFVMRNNWFVISQTDGRDYAPETLTDWNQDEALSALAITVVPFEMTNGNIQGYALPGRKLALNPVGDHLNQTLFHELAHIVLGHCEEDRLNDSESTPRNLREVEAESVAMLCSDALGLDGAEYSRGYIQGWAAGIAAIPEASCQKIFKAANAILEAGRKAVNQA